MAHTASPQGRRTTLMHIQEISETPSSVAELDLSDLVYSRRRRETHDGGSGLARTPSKTFVNSRREQYEQAVKNAAATVNLLASPRSGAGHRALSDPSFANVHHQRTPQRFASPRTLPDYARPHSASPYSEFGYGRSHSVPIAGDHHRAHLDMYDHSRPIAPDDRSISSRSSHAHHHAAHEYAMDSCEPQHIDDRYQLGVGYEHHNSARLAEERRRVRLKTLEREYGSKPPAKLHTGDDEKASFKARRANEKAAAERVNESLGITKEGTLVTEGRRTRFALRWTQGVLAFCAVVGGPAGAFLTHPDKSSDTPPSGKITTYLLYVYTVAAFVTHIWLFVLRPFMLRRRNRNAPQAQPQYAQAGFALPIFNAGGPAYNAIGAENKKKRWFGRASKEPARMPNSQPMTVNLVVDPVAMARMSGNSRDSRPPARCDGPSRYGGSGYHSGDGDSDEDDDATAVDTLGKEEDEDFHIPRKAREKQGPMSVFDAMQATALHERWRAARLRMRRQGIEDAVLALLWALVSTACIGWGGTCKPGAGKGWCDLYNIALASGVMIAVAYGASCTFDVIDLRRNRFPPRVTRPY